MTMLPPRSLRMTPEQYLTCERLAETRSEFHDGELVSMAGARPRHILIVTNLIVSFYKQLDESGCKVYSNDLRVGDPSQRRYYYPDLAIVCGPEEFEEGSDDVLVNPVVLVEVLSPLTERIDRDLKVQRYQLIDSLREYVLVSTQRRRIEVYRRGDEGTWLYESYPFKPWPARLASVECRLDPDEVYRNVDVPEE